MHGRLDPHPCSLLLHSWLYNLSRCTDLGLTSAPCWIQMEEGWVQCDDCQGWVHQICGLFNKGNNKDDAAFHCPACLEEGLQTGRRDQVG